MDNQNKYQPKAAGLNPKATFDPKQKVVAGASHKGGKANSTQNILQLAEIRDGLVIMNDGSFRIVVFCRPINFVLMSEQERSAVEYSYQGFLNSLFFPIQVMIRSRKVDASHYIELLYQAQQNQSNMLLELVMEDYINFMADLIATTDIMEKFFYVVVPYSPGEESAKENIVKNTQGFFGKLFKLGRNSNQLVIEESALTDAKRELRRRGQVVIEGLQQCGVMGVPLNTEELIELYYESYNPDTSGGHQLASLKDLSTPLVTRAGEPAAPPQPAPVMPVAEPPVMVQPPMPAVIQALPVAGPPGIAPQMPAQYPPPPMAPAQTLPVAGPGMVPQMPAQYPPPMPPPATQTLPAAEPPGMVPQMPAQYPPPPMAPAQTLPVAGPGMVPQVPAQYPPPKPPAQAVTLTAGGQWPPQPMAIAPQFNPYPPA